ncbi:MAG TPA: hypothetical protein VFB59_02850 [Candidatus Saccharimonadales bacterium]|nr:hypothetical protein [Candidatus Saccharimonadales bacterium]
MQPLDRQSGRQEFTSPAAFGEQIYANALDEISQGRRLARGRHRADTPTIPVNKPYVSARPHRTVSSEVLHQHTQFSPIQTVGETALLPVIERHNT